MRRDGEEQRRNKWLLHSKGDTSDDEPDDLEGSYNQHRYDTDEKQPPLEGEAAGDELEGTVLEGGDVAEDETGWLEEEEEVECKVEQHDPAVDTNVYLRTREEGQTDFQSIKKLRDKQATVILTVLIRVPS